MFDDEFDLDLENEPYQFYILRVGRIREDYYLGTDSGSSCPMPFENYKALSYYTGPLTREQAREEAESLIRVAGEAWGVYTPVGPNPVDVENLMKWFGLMKWFEKEGEN